MGRHPLLILLALGVLGCEPPVRSGSADPHAGLACARCHDGGLADRSQAAVPAETCSASGCHDRDVPATVRLATVEFAHLNHGSTGQLAMGCAGCHTHGAGGEPLRAGPETCGLCHEDALDGDEGEDCRLCHATPDHVGMTSQGVGIPHQGLPWIEGGCVRCHYAVSRPVHEVTLDRCAACHSSVEGATAQGIGMDLHPTHTGVSCAACHEEDNHRIEAMSAAVDLSCSGCHTDVHGTPAGGSAVSAGTCNTCHEGVHAGPQRILLGILPGAEAASPSVHFMGGVSCQSCHIPPDDGSAEAALSGTARACVQCHRSEYLRVLDWWEQGLRDRIRLVDAYLSGAEAAVAGRGADDPARAAVERSRTLLTLVTESGGQHNLPLTHRIFEDAVAGAAQAYRLTGRGVPPEPQLGRAPRPGICAYCHYRLQDPGFSATMDDAFHREVLGLR